jgi:hypothetical protein
VHTSEDRKRNVRIFEPSQGFDTPLTMPLKNPLIPLPIPKPRVPQSFKAALKVVVAAERTLDGPEDLTTETAAQTGFYTHQGLDGQGSSIRPGALTPDTPSPSQ